MQREGDGLHVVWKEQQLEYRDMLAFLYSYIWGRESVLRLVDDESPYLSPEWSRVSI